MGLYCSRCNGENIMSLIRSTSNMEKIYAYHNINGNTYIHKGPEYTICISTKTFGKVINKWLENFEDETVEWDGFKISQKLVDGLNTIFLRYTASINKDIVITMSYATFFYMTYDYRRQFDLNLEMGWKT